MAQAGNKSNDVSLAAMKGKLVGTQSSTVFANYLDKYYKGLDVKLYPGGDEPLLDLANGRLDYTVGDILVAQQFIEKNPGCCRIVAEIKRTPDMFGPGVGAAFRPEDKDLAAMFNKAIAEVDADGEFKTLKASTSRSTSAASSAAPASTIGGGGMGSLGPCCSARTAGRPCC